MALARMGVRTVLIAVAVLVAAASMAAPSWAAKGGNSANAALCKPGNYAGVLLAQDGSAFKNAGKCTSYAAQGGQLVGVDAVAGEGGAVGFPISCSGFGVKAGVFVDCGAKYRGGSGGGMTFGFSAAADGTFSRSNNFPCDFGGSEPVSLVVEATTPAGVFFTREFPPPSGCEFGL